MKNMLRYKGYYGSIDFEPDDMVFYGKLEFIRPLVSYEGETALEIKNAFIDAVDDYLLMCEQQNIQPEKPFKGSFNVRVGPERHEKAAILAKKLGYNSLNEFVNLALDHEIERLARR